MTKASLTKDNIDSIQAGMVQEELRVLHRVLKANRILANRKLG